MVEHIYHIVSRIHNRMNGILQGCDVKKLYDSLGSKMNLFNNEL